MFGRNKTVTAPQQPSNPQKAAQRDPRAGKGMPTPSRKQQEAARRRPLVPQDRHAAKQVEREARRESQMRMRTALDTGDERFLPPRDKGPQRRMVRDLIDVRTGLGEFVMFIALAIVVSTFVMPGNFQMQSYVLIGFWAVVLIVALDSYLLGRRLRQHLAARFGAGNIEQGVVWYGVMRSLQFRKLRLPKPQVQRGQPLNY